MGGPLSSTGYPLRCKIRRLAGLFHSFPRTRHLPGKSYRCLVTFEYVVSDIVLITRSFCRSKAMQTTGGMEHPGILHLYCHLMELSGDPLAAMPAADTLRTLYPQASHLVHMASHIDVWAGQYKVSLLVAQNVNAAQSPLSRSHNGLAQPPG